jgi:hypothetical protein
MLKTTVISEGREKLVNITSQLPALVHSGFVTCEPCDAPEGRRRGQVVLTLARIACGRANTVPADSL